MTDPTGLGYTEPITEPGWVDALCTCGHPEAHVGLYCPSRAPEEQVVPADEEEQG